MIKIDVVKKTRLPAEGAASSMKKLPAGSQYFPSVTSNLQLGELLAGTQPRNNSLALLVGIVPGQCFQGAVKRFFYFRRKQTGGGLSFLAMVSNTLTAYSLARTGLVRAGIIFQIFPLLHSISKPPAL